MDKVRAKGELILDYEIKSAFLKVYGLTLVQQHPNLTLS